MLRSISFLCLMFASAIVSAALPISAVQTTDFDSLVLAPFADIDPPDDLIDDLTYDGWRYDPDTGSSPGIINRNTPLDEDISTTTVSISTADGSEFRAVSIDFSAYGGPGSSPPYYLELHGFRDGASVPGFVISRTNISPGAIETLALNWDNIDAIRVVVNSDFLVFDNVTVGPVASSSPSGTAASIPTTSVYGLVLSALGLLIFAWRHFRA